ncbi:MAG: hypothetical protein ACREVS_00840 [Burkholderiales bacterium]
MRIQCNRARATGRVVVASLLIALLAACASSPPQRPQRTYDHVPEPTLLWFAMEGVLKSAGYEIGRRDMARREVETAWKEYDVAARGRERRKYYAWYELASLQNRYDVFLELNVQERLPAVREWADKQVVPEQDAEYVRILQELDGAVKKIGGVRY